MAQHEAKKSKVVSIILALFFGLFTWVYTWKFDSWKFWLNLGLCVITLGLWAVVAWLWAIGDAIFKSKKKLIHYYD